MYDLNKEDDMVVASSGIGDDSHREPVCKVHWIPDPESKGKKYHVSVWREGKRGEGKRERGEGVGRGEMGWSPAQGSEMCNRRPGEQGQEISCECFSY